MNWLSWLPENASSYGADVDGVIAIIWYTTIVWCFLTFGTLAAGAILWWAIFTGNLLALLGPPETLDAVLAYSVLHVLAFVLFGLTTTALVAAADEPPLGKGER